MTAGSPRTGVLLVNLGSPESPGVRDVRRFLREFLGDPRVIDLHPVLRSLLLHLVILPLRPRASARMYASIWTERGSPLLVHSYALRDALARRIGPRYVVKLAMRYGTPSIESQIEELEASDVVPIVVVPLFPQYASSSAGSASQRVLEVASRRPNVPALRAVPSFHDHPAFLSALAEVARPVISEIGADHLLMSYHGLPERQVRRSDPTGTHCLAREDCCASIGPANRACYRAQCFSTSSGLAARLGWREDAYTVSFQSRLGRARWIGPYTETVFEELAGRGVRRLAVICPSFVADCLETLEEIGIRGRARWKAAGGEAFALIPCLNAHPAWVEALAELVRSAAAEAAPAGRSDVAP